MTERKNIVLLAGFILSASLVAASLTALFLSEHYNHLHIQMLGEICQEITERQPEAKQAVLWALKEYPYRAGAAVSSASKEYPHRGAELSVLEEYPFPSESSEEGNILLLYGYDKTDFIKLAGSGRRLSAAAGVLAGGGLSVLTLLYWHRRNVSRIRQLTDYLERVNSGGSGDLFQVGEDDFSRLQDEIYKTVTELYQTRDAALKARKNFAENLYNIAHQIKTPITAISLSVQMMQEEPAGKQLEQVGQQFSGLTHSEQMRQQFSGLNHLEQMRQQLARLTHLEEALLLLSRIDAGTLPLERREVDVFTVLMLAADNLQALFREAGVSVEIPEADETLIYADLDWTMEAVMNLLKNCMEHTPPGGTVHCSYEQNLLYTQIRIWDNGCGFAREDLPHVFERFYRGQNAKAGGIGIGLALSRAILEGQNGTLTARNLPEGGACFEIHLYHVMSK